MKKIKNTLSIIGAAVLIILYEIVRFNSQKAAYRELGNLSIEMRKAPISIAYVIVAIAALYFIGNRPFFRGMQVEGEAVPFLVKNKKSTAREVFVTIIFGLILFAFVAGFFIIMSI